MSELIFVLLFFGVPGLIGSVMARKRGKNPILWGALSALFPFVLLVLKTQYKPVSGSRALDQSSQEPEARSQNDKT